MTINQLFNSRIKVSKKSMANSIKSMSIHFNEFDSTIKNVSDLNLDVVESFRNYLLYDATKPNGDPISHNSASVYFMSFRHCLKYAYRGGHTEKDLSTLVDGISIKSVERHHLTENEITTLLDAQSDDQRVKDISYISLTTGMRFGDITKLREKNLRVDVDTGVHSIVFTQQKTGSLTELPISKKTFDIASKLVKDNSFKDYCYNRMNYVLKKWFNTAGLPTKKSFFHIFRHTFATMQIENGTDIFTVQDLMGHKSVNTTQIYARASYNNKVNAIIEL